MVPHLLRIDSSANSSDSVSRALTGLFAHSWRSIGPQYTVVERDLHADPPPHLTDPGLHWAPRLRRSGEHPSATAQALQADLIAEVDDAAAVVIGAPMYNWSMPSTLKAWIDHVHVLGTTVPFDRATRPFEDKPVVVIATRGNTYGPGSRNAGADHVVPALGEVLAGSLGMAMSVVTVDFTLARRIPAMNALVGSADDSVKLAEEEVRRLAAEVAPARRR